MEHGNFREALDMANEGCAILEAAVTNGKHLGYYPQYMCRLTADLYSAIGKIEYELNLPGHGGLWFEKADTHRQKLIQHDTVQSFDLKVMAIGDCSIALASIAETGDPDSTVKACTFLMDQYGNDIGRNSWAGNLAVAHRIQGNLKESLKWCKKAQDWTRESYGDSSLGMAMSVIRMLLARDKADFMV